MSYSCRGNFKISIPKYLIFWGILCFFQGRANAQVTNQDAKTALIIKLANNVHWENESDIKEHAIALYGVDTSTFESINNIPDAVKINKKPITISWINNLDNLQEFTILYVDQSRSTDLSQVLKCIENKQILLISENSPDLRNIMINLIPEDSKQKVFFEINKANLIIEKFWFTDQLLSLGAKEVDLRALNQEMKLRLEDEMKEVATLSQELYLKQKEIERFQANIEVKIDSIKKLSRLASSYKSSINKKEEELLIKEKGLKATYVQLNENQQLLTHQMKSSDEQKSKIQQQILQLEAQESMIKRSTLILDSLKNVSNNLEKSLDERELTIGIKQQLINSRERLLYGFVFFSLILAALSFFTYRAFSNKRSIAEKLNYSHLLLSDQHNNILKLNKELNASNEELNTMNSALDEQKTALSKALEDLEKTQIQMLQSEKMAALGVLTAGVAHEINNPLNFILSGVVGLKYLMSDITESINECKEINEIGGNILSEKKESLEQFFETIDLGVERVAAIVKSLSSFSRGGESEIVNCNIHELLDNCLIILRNEHKDLVEIVKNYGNKDLYAYGNQSKLYQVFLNLLTNSIQAIKPNEGKIIITAGTKSDSQEIEVIIEDSGIGMSEDILAKIFDPFYTTKDVGFGTGLGLSIVYNIIKEHQGSIYFTSKPSQGTKVNIILPIS
jgi:signal transduction histidine kinase